MIRWGQKRTGSFAIHNCIDNESIRIGTVPVSPGLTNTRRVEGSQAEDAIPGESYITFDLRLSLTLHKKSVKIIINLEAQKSSDVRQIGYHLENRIKRKLKEKYDMQMTVELEGRLANMCNLSDLIEERGIQRGMECGIQRGMERGIQCGIERGMEQGISAMIFDNLEENTSKERIIERQCEIISVNSD